jgi:hypothetical protein
MALHHMCHFFIFFLQNIVPHVWELHLAPLVNAVVKRWSSSSHLYRICHWLRHYPCYMNERWSNQTTKHPPFIIMYMILWSKHTVEYLAHKPGARLSLLLALFSRGKQSGWFKKSANSGGGGGKNLRVGQTTAASEVLGVDSMGGGGGGGVEEVTGREEASWIGTNGLNRWHVASSCHNWSCWLCPAIPVRSLLEGAGW